MPLILLFLKLVIYFATKIWGLIAQIPNSLMYINSKWQTTLSAKSPMCNKPKYSK